MNPSQEHTNFSTSLFVWCFVYSPVCGLQQFLDDELKAGGQTVGARFLLVLSCIRGLVRCLRQRRKGLGRKKKKKNTGTRLSAVVQGNVESFAPQMFEMMHSTSYPTDIGRNSGLRPQALDETRQQWLQVNLIDGGFR